MRSSGLIQTGYSHVCNIAPSGSLARALSPWEMLWIWRYVCVMAVRRWWEMEVKIEEDKESSM